MRINKFYEPHIRENYVEIHYREMDQETIRLFAFLEAGDSLIGRNSGETRVLIPHDIYYCEIVDRKCYAYLKDEVWQVDAGIKTLTEQYAACGFVRISKSMLVNAYQIEKLKADLNMRVNIILQNKETVILNRAYKKEFYQYLKYLKGGNGNGNYQ